ncbi:MAG: hypothetical protein ACRYGP_00025 [Janthinobacterium lividum]
MTRLHEDRPADTGRWCILRTAGPRTLPLARSLNAAGIEAWTPMLVVNWRRPRSKATVERDAPILPTFVFVAEHHLADVLAILDMPVSPHPPFSVFRFAGRVPRIRSGKMAALRAYEASEAAKYQRAKDRAASKPTKPRGTMPDIGVTVRVVGEGVLFGGMTGTVVGQKNRSAVVDFGGSIPIDIEAWLLSETSVDAVPA